MPEALARADHDFVQRDDKRSTKSRRNVQTGARFSFARRFVRRPGRTFLFAGVAIMLLGIGVNALFLQSARHPAPFFRQAEEAKSVPPAAAAAVPTPPSRPAEAAVKPPVRQAAAQPAAAAPAIAPEKSVAAPVENKPAPAARANPKETTQLAVAPKADPIGALLREGRPGVPTPPASIPNPSAEQTKRIVAVQEALKKLGHDIKPDGVAGTTTRAAIESFERTQKLQVSGQMSPRVLRELSTRSGVKIP